MLLKGKRRATHVHYAKEQAKNFNNLKLNINEYFLNFYIYKLPQYKIILLTAAEILGEKLLSSCNIWIIDVTINENLDNHECSVLHLGQADYKM